MEAYIRAFAAVIRYVLPLLSVCIVTFAFLPILKRKPLFSAFILFEDSSKIDLINSETLIGSGENCDVKIKGLSREHAVITKKNNKVYIRAINNKTVLVNNCEISKETSVSPYDVIKLGKTEFTVRHKATDIKKTQTSRFTYTAFWALMLYEFFTLLQFSFIYLFKNPLTVFAYFAFLLFQVVYFCIVKFKKANIEIIVFYLITVGLNVVAGISSFAFIKQLICAFLGFIAAFVLYKVLASKKLCDILKIPALIVGAGLFLVNIVLGTVYNGAQNWIEISNVSFQPSELIKVIFVFLSAATLESLSKRLNALMFTVYGAFCVAVLAYLSDYGTAAVYIAAFVTVLMLRRSNWKAFFAVSGIGVVLLTFATLAFPYVAKRLFSFGQAWQNAATSGYQQTRTMIAAASGGFLGVGTGNGYLRNVIAFDTDIVLGLICEELGLITALCVAVCFVLLAFYAVKCISFTSPYYSIPACAVAVMFLAQAALNIFGSFDMLPFTGVTLPFISNGGSSLISCVALTAFFKAAERDLGIKK